MLLSKSKVVFEAMQEYGLFCQIAVIDWAIDPFPRE